MVFYCVHIESFQTFPIRQCAKTTQSFCEAPLHISSVAELYSNRGRTYVMKARTNRSTLRDTKPHRSNLRCLTWWTERNATPNFIHSIITVNYILIFTKLWRQKLNLWKNVLSNSRDKRRLRWPSSSLPPFLHREGKSGRGGSMSNKHVLISPKFTVCIFMQTNAQDCLVSFFTRKFKNDERLLCYNIV